MQKISSNIPLNTASNIYIDENTKACEVTLDVDDFHDEMDGYIIGSGVGLKMIDYSDVYSFKYVISYKSYKNFSLFKSQFGLLNR